MVDNKKWWKSWKSPTIKIQGPHGPLKILWGNRITPEQQVEITRRMKEEADARRTAMHKWTDDEVRQYVEAFKMQRPDQYAEYVRQEHAGYVIEAELANEMRRFAATLFPQATLLDRGDLFFKARITTRKILNLDIPDR